MGEKALCTPLMASTWIGAQVALVVAWKERNKAYHSISLRIRVKRRLTDG